MLTGGYVSMFLVTKYNIEGETEDLPNLIYGRCNHACGEVTRSDGSIVSLGMEHENIMNVTFHPSTLQTYIVTGGEFYGGEILSSTEILVKDGGTSWKSVAELPYKARSLRGVSLDNGLFIVTGKNILGVASLN